MIGNQIPKPKFIREFRLGLVVYGGVSLAVYMNGVCREFYNAVRGRGVYKLIKALTDSDIVVDIISGTSAGGINGVLLSYSLANSSEKETYDFENFSGVWRDSGDINELLRQVKSPGDVNSILDGEGYYQKELTAAFQSVWEKRSKAPDDDWFSDFNELDLFVTGTDVLGKVSRQFDNTGKLIEVNDHHAVFILKHRKDRKTPFQPENNGIPQKALAKLCRITSCFPVAFPVVSVNLEEVDPQNSVDKKLVEWGNLNNRVKPKERPENGYQLHFVDGGVLDNRPFSYTIREIYYRHFHRPVIRKLFYIDPSPDKFLDSIAFKKMAKPNIWESAMDSLVGLPRYESIAVDLQEIAEKNERVRRYRYLRSSVVSSAVEALGHQATADISSKQTYLRCRLIGLRDRVLPIVTGLTQAKEDSTLNTDQKNTLQIAADLLAYYPDPDKQKAREEYLNQKGNEVEGLDVDYLIRKHFFIQEEIMQAIVSNKYSHFHECLENLARYLNRMLSLLEVIKFAIDSMFLTDQIQIDFAKLIQKTNVVNNLPESNALAKKDKIKKTDDVRNEVFDYLLHLHRFLLDPDQLLGESSFETPQEDQSYLNSAKTSFFKALSAELPVTLKVDDLDKWLSIKSVDNILRQLKMRAESLGNVDTLDKNILNMPTIWHEKYKFQETIKYHSILSCVDDISRQLIGRLGTSFPDNNKLEQTPIKELKELSEKLLHKFCRFDYIDQQVYPYEYLSDIQSDSLLEIARISPDDSQKGFGKDKKLEDRLAGLQLRAFGGFFKKSWRANDILWGRLDGLNRLVDCLLTRTTVKSFKKFKQRYSQIQNSDLVEEALPNATPEEKQAIVNILDKLAKEEQINDEDFQDLLDHIVLAGQRAILTTDLKNVLNDTIEEQFSWNQQLGIPDSADLYEIGYRSEHDRTSSSNDQLQGLKQIDTLLDRLLEPKSKFGDGCQRYIEEIMKVHGQKGVENNLRKQLKIAFPHSTKSTREDLSNRLFLLLLKLNNKQIDYKRINRFDKTSKAFTSGFILALIPSIDLLLSVSEEEKKALKIQNTTASSETINGIVNFNNQLGNVSRKLNEALNNLKPIFSPTDGYLDKPLIPYVTGSLVDSSIQVMMNDPQKMENYFRYQYRVGSEKVIKNIPPVIRNKLLTRSGLVVRDILRSKPTGEVLSKNPIFIVFDNLLRTIYFLVDANDPATSFVPKVLLPLLSWIIRVFAPLFVIAFLISQIPRLLLGVIITLLIAQLVYSTYGKKGSIKLAFNVFSFLLVFMILAHEFVGLPLPHKGTIRLKRLFNDYCPRIQTPFTDKDCKS
jgi:patatin-related protein